MMQKGQIFIWIIVGSLVILIAGGAYYLGRSTSPKLSTTPTVVSPTPQPTHSPTNIPTPTGAEETANWKTYTNTKYGYSIKYPPDYLMEEFEPDKNARFIQDVCLVPKGGQGCIASILITSESIDEYLNSSKDDSNYRIIVKDYEVGGIKGKWLEYLAKHFNNQVTFVHFVFQKNNYLFDISTDFWGSPFQDTFKLMLPTFEFR